jgi:hypothetical protein
LDHSSILPDILVKLVHTRKISVWVEDQTPA